MSKLYALKQEIIALEKRGLVVLENDVMHIVCNKEEVTDRLLQTGPWGALLLLGRLPQALAEIRDKEVMNQ